MSINSHMVKVIVDIAVFLEYTNSDLLDEDVAVEAMEQIAGELQQMSESDQRKLANQIVEYSVSYTQPQSDFVKGLPEAMGIG